MLKRTLSFAMMAVFIVVMSFGVQAQEKVPFKIVEDTVQSPIGNYVDLAMDLVQFGYDNNSAISLVQAAAIFTAIPVGTLTLTETPQGKEANALVSYRYDPKVLMSDAKKMAQNDKDLLAYVVSIENRMNEHLETKGESPDIVDQAAISIKSGETCVKYLYAPKSNSRYRVRIRGERANLRMSVNSTRGDFKGSIEDIHPSLAFWIGPAQDVKISILNSSSKSIDCEIILEKILDPKDIGEQVLFVIGVLGFLLG